MAKGLKILGSVEFDDAHTPTIETEFTHDYTYSQLAPIDFWIQ